MLNKLLLLGLTLVGAFCKSQNYPLFGPEKKVTINGLSFDAMEPFISLTGDTLFFNSLNSGGNTNLHYATKVDDTTFNYVGLVAGTYDSSPDHLDAVASIDSANNFFWVSLRDFPNLYHGNYSAGTVSNIKKTYGNFNIFTPGWIIMDAAISYQGDLLYYCNAYFGPTFTECPGAPCEARLGVAQKDNDSTFSKLINSNDIFASVNDTNYIVYAPQVTKDGLELYYTRILDGTYNTEICVAVRNNINDPFGNPIVIYDNYGFFPEAASPTTDKQKIYYHQKNIGGTYEIYLRYRIGTSSIKEPISNQIFTVFPNPTHGIINFSLPNYENQLYVKIYTLQGQEIISTSVESSIDISHLQNGCYVLQIFSINADNIDSFNSNKFLIYRE